MQYGELIVGATGMCMLDFDARMIWIAFFVKEVLS